MFDFVYVDPEKISEKYYFPDRKMLVSNHEKITTPGPVPKYWIGFSYIRLEYYQLYLDFDETEMRGKSDHSSNNKVQLFRENILFIEEEWFSDMNLIDGATFLTYLVKLVKSRFNLKINYPRDTKGHM